jgi:hypothetical protein
MKKVSYFAIALVIMGFVACKSNKTTEGEENAQDTVSTMIENGASEAIDNAAKVDEVLNQESDDELFGTDVDDAAVEGATTK